MLFLQFLQLVVNVMNVGGPKQEAFIVIFIFPVCMPFAFAFFA